MRQIVVDTNVVVAALKSSRGASFRLLQLLPSPKFETNLSPSLVYEYQEVLGRPSTALAFSLTAIEAVIDGLCAVSNRIRIHYRWRPFLIDPGDDMIVELAVAASCGTIVTFNKADFVGVDQFGIAVQNPAEFLRTIGELS